MYAALPSGMEHRRFHSSSSAGKMAYREAMTTKRRPGRKAVVY